MCVQRDQEQTLREAAKMECVCPLLPISAFLWWRKNHDEFHVVNVIQQSSIFMIIQYIQTHEHSAPQIPNTEQLWLAHSIPVTAITSIITCSVLWQIRTFPSSFFEVCPVFAVGMLPHVQHRLCCPQRLQSTFSSTLHLFLLPPPFSQW